jgi:hypothetical protein
LSVLVLPGLWLWPGLVAGLLSCWGCRCSRGWSI